MKRLLALLIIISIQVAKSKNHVVKVWRAIGLFILRDGKNVRLRTAAAGLIQEITIGAAQSAAKPASLANRSVNGVELVEAIVAIARREKRLQGVVFFKVRNHLPEVQFIAVKTERA